MEGGLIFFKFLPVVWAAAPGSRRSRRRFLHACARLGVPVGTLRVDEQDAPLLGCAGARGQHACAIVIRCVLHRGRKERRPLGAEPMGRNSNPSSLRTMVLHGTLHGFISLRAMPMVNYYQGASLHGGRDAERQWASGGEASESGGQMRRSMLVLDRLQAPPPPNEKLPDHYVT